MKPHNMSWLGTLSLLLFVLIPGQISAQRDSARISILEHKIGEIEDHLKKTDIRLSTNEQKTFYLYRNLQRPDSAQDSSHLVFSGYMDMYYGIYSDSVTGKFQQFPTSAPKSDHFGLNMVYVGAKYDGSRLRGVLGIHLGDIALSAWSTELNLIQEANFGIRLARKFWLDAGFFRTHIGMESIQPRENIGISVATSTYFEPYYLSGVKLTWHPAKKFSLQANAFNSFNTYFETNTNKALGFSAIYIINDNSVITANTLLSDESPAGSPLPHKRLYNDVYFVLRNSRVELGVEGNAGIQENSRLHDSTATAFMYSGIIAFKYKLSRLAPYVRAEVFQDTDEILTGPLENQYHQPIGLNMLGGTAGLEFKPLPNVYLRAEGRYLHSTQAETIFYWNGEYRNYRMEFLTSLGAWF